MSALGGLADILAVKRNVISGHSDCTAKGPLTRPVRLDARSCPAISAADPSVINFLNYLSP
jgi:hypothetical protein